MKNKSGIVALYFGNDFIDRHAYDSVTRRGQIIEKWKKIYGPAFERATITDFKEPQEEPSRFKEGDVKLTRRLNNVPRSVKPWGYDLQRHVIGKHLK